ncbi:7-carboxy-7-deazaguanine synthase [Hahella sp. KA22]|uniref:7-carboxy-7-deazaguanine synthase n=1 Tax=Hahella sp. KA22 TaxID=1628392 RepID=UPI000FDE2827|nr:7-carboxy-7-deazaguanine synthase [Hahella sp. KA22]AZZ95034.1 7-carboxy-7-deazaguanine synthase [Hahella sp. KA22]QAY52679.1 7-carboxy-7-deazaguanine synthase [Hahella sp. KA22]
MYRVKEIFYTLQGEGAHQGRPAVFCRFSKCNLWTGREKDRAGAVCNFCDTDFVGVDGQNGGKFATAEELAERILSFWPQEEAERFVVCTGGEPLLQLDEPLVEAFHARGFEVAVETNGTLPAPAGIDWLCVSPKGRAEVVIKECDELKLVYPQPEAPPERFDDIRAGRYYLSPMANPLALEGEDERKIHNTKLAMDFCMRYPKWRLSVQLHKILGID